MRQGLGFLLYPEFPTPPVRSPPVVPTDFVLGVQRARVEGKDFIGEIWSSSSSPTCVARRLKKKTCVARTYSSAIST
jgi:hypothetical protein